MLSDLKTVPLGELASFEMGQSPDSLFVTDAGHGIPFLQGSAEFGAVTPQHSFYCTKPQKICEINDVLISVRAPVGTLNKADRVYCIGRGLAAIRFKKGTLPKFGWHLLNYWASELRKVAQGSTFEAIGKAELANLPIIYLPETEQQCIAEILDTIDEAIAHTSSIIAKLKQIKDGLLHDLLTRGLDENGELRDAIAHPEQFKNSLLGRIPKDWEIELFGEHIANLSSGWSPVCDPEPVVDGEWGVLKTTAIVWNGYNPLENKKLPSSLQPREQGVVAVDDILITRKGPRDRVGVVVHVASTPPNLMMPDTVFRIRLKASSRLLPAFAPLTLGSLVVQKDWNCKKIGLAEAQVGINYGIVRGTLVHIPPQNEQKLIIEIVNTYNSRIFTEETYLEKFRLQKKGLMNDLLTGRVRVNTSQKISA